MARKIVIFVLFFAAALAATAQSQPPAAFNTVSIPAASVGGHQLGLSDLTHSAVQVVYPDSILTVHTDGTTSSTVLPVTAASYDGDGSGRYGIIGCISDKGLVATSAPDPLTNDIRKGSTNIQVVDTIGGTSQKLTLKMTKYGIARACVFGKQDGLLYVGADIPNATFRAIPGIITVDPTTMQVVRTTMTDEANLIESMAATQSGVYAFNQSITQRCVTASNCPTSIGKIGSDSTYQVLYQTSMGLTATPITSAPNGYLFAGGKTFDENGQPALMNNGLGLYTSVAFPSINPGYAYKTYLGFFGGVDIASNSEAINLAAASNQYLAVAAQRQSDGTDLVIALRDTFVDFFRVTPPQVMSTIANAGSLQPGPLAPGSIITVFGQALGAWEESDTADGAKVVTKLGNTQVFVDGNIAHPIRLLYVGYGQVNAILPSNLSVGDKHGLTVQNGSASVTRFITIADQTLAAFMWAPDPANQTTVAPILTDSSYRLLGNPALSPAYAQANPATRLPYGQPAGEGLLPHSTIRSSPCRQTRCII
jgi:hypothetical protein